MSRLDRRTFAQGAALAGFGAIGATPSFAQPAPFFRGKTIRMLIGAGAGGGYDIAGRLVADHMGRHIPGNPSFVVENMAGASGLPMTNYLYNRAPRDGTAMGMPNSGTPLEPRLKLLTRSGGTALFDIDKLAWIGSSVRQTQVLFVWGDKVKSLDDLRRTQLVVGSEGVSADNYLYPYFCNRLLGANMKIVPGYPGQTDIFLAVERGELQGCVTRFSTLKVNQSGWLKDRKGHIVMQFGPERIGELPDVPTAAELTDSTTDADMLRFYSSKDDFACPLALPPEVPEDRVAILRTAFDATMRDEAYLAAARRVGVDANPLSGAQVAAMVDALQKSPDAVVERLRALLQDASARKP